MRWGGAAAPMPGSCCSAGSVEMSKADGDPSQTALLGTSDRVHVEPDLVEFFRIKVVASIEEERGPLHPSVDPLIVKLPILWPVSQQRDRVCAAGGRIRVTFE